MSITPPDPGRVLAVLRTTLEQLRELARVNPTDPRAATAIPGVEQAVKAMAAPAPQCEP
jgi:hypothetical protein